MTGVVADNEWNWPGSELLLTLWSSFLRSCLPSMPCSGSWSQRRVTQRKCCWRRSSEPCRRGLDNVAIRKLASQKRWGPGSRQEVQKITSTFGLSKAQQSVIVPELRRSGEEGSLVSRLWQRSPSRPVSDDAFSRPSSSMTTERAPWPDAAGTRKPAIF